MLWGVVRVTANPPVYVGGGPKNDVFTAEDFDSADQRANVYSFFRQFPDEIYVAVPFVPGKPANGTYLPTCPAEILEAIGFSEEDE